AQTVTQSQPETSVQEAETVTLDCTYATSESNYYLFWYKQPPSRQMILIIRQEAYKQQNATENRFSVNFQKAAKSFSLKISDSQLGDAAMYFCAFMVHTTVTQSQPKMSVRRGETVTLDCTYATSVNYYYLYWHKQTPSGQMILVISQGSHDQQPARRSRVSVDFQKAAKLFSLRISDSRPEDAALYFCVFSERRPRRDKR
uniref:Ig-like domain-containing protein n=1 Tax=Prolemur simus TaxID=1328070 RepID=A0A8C8ZEW0_PROSS